MDVYSASDGGVVQLDRGLSDWDSLEQLVTHIAEQFGVTIENVLLFLDDGRELRKEVLESLWERGGMGASQSQPPRQTLYLFNRETFWSEPEKWATELQEDVQFPPPLNMMALHDLQQAETPFAIVYDHLQHLRSLSQAQSRALQIAYANLFHHLSPIITEFQTFAGRAEKELEEQERLIKGARGDMAMLPKVVIHEAFMKKRERQESGSSIEVGQDKAADSKVKTLADYVHPRKMEQVRESCRATHEDLVNRYNDLAQQMDELAASSDAERAVSEEKAAEVAAEFQEGLQRIEAALDQIAILVNSNADGAAQDLMELDQAMRDDLSGLTHVKNEYTLEVHIHLRKVAHFQSRITQIVQPLTVLDTELRNKGAFPHLARLHRLPFAYAASVVEVVQRKEFADHLSKSATRLAEALGAFMSKERGRRRQLRADTLSQLPWGVPALDDSMAPNIEIAVVTGAESLVGMHLTREDLDAIARGIEELKMDAEIANATEADAENPVEYLEKAYASLISKMGDASKGLDQVLRDSTQPESGAEGTMHQADHEKAISGLHTEYQAHIRLLEERHESESAALQRRQGELQEQLVRVRNDLGEEIMARQARSAELMERSRERDEKAREYEDHIELNAALQAELAQEKDRATDLGVRLQEALLDVDGMKNAEQTHVVQMQGLQDERSRSLQALSTAQQHSAGLESQLAGLQAELAATTQQLQKARLERDTALRNQSAEAERAMRDRIAEADGDRAVLEHQNLTLTKQLEDLKVEMENKLSATRNTATRQADGLKAELSFTKAQLRDAQRREMTLADELAMLKDSSTAMSQDRSHQSDVARDAVDLARQYYETCQRVLSAINTSATISGTTSTQLARPKTPQSAAISVSSKDELRESVLVRSLAQAQAFDLVGFGEAVTRTIALVKKWNKASRQYRDAAKNKISFANFTKGDLALFLPTRNAAARSWAAFNSEFIHNLYL
ncbi:putative myosin heavy chain [Naematelia encephala]|uniref:Autophagy-related protein 11 n=1 Tax=Naematelia encephala TaxID=71784 RepID=A0A1Y2AT15_9TREE|nr:putative myosin heavy chain [Naematelia encephala]